MPDWLLSLASGLTGAVIGAIASSFMGILTARKLREEEVASNINNVISALSGELNVVAELISIDAKLESFQTKAQAVEVLDRIESHDAVFLGNREKISLLPVPLIPAITRFYSRKSAKVAAMMKLVEGNRFFMNVTGNPATASERTQYAEHQNQLEIEVESLRNDLANTTDSSSAR